MDVVSFSNVVFFICHHFEKFHSKPDYIYPSISLCGSDIFYDSKLKELGASQAKYESFLKGEHFDKDIANIPYHDVVSNPIDKLLGIKMYLESVKIINIVEIRTCCMIKCWQPILNSHQACAMNSARIFQQWTP